MTIVLKS